MMRVKVFDVSQSDPEVVHPSLFTMLPSSQTSEPILMPSLWSGKILV